MQIHELNNYSGDLDLGAYLAVDNGNDTGKVSAKALTNEVSRALVAAEEELNARIDNIIAGGTAPSAAEVTDARLGAALLGSIAYPSLGAAIRGQATLLKNELNNSVELLNNKNLLNPNDSDYISGAYLDASGVRHDTVYYNETGFIPVSQGETLVISYDNNGVRDTGRIRFVTAYDADKTVMQSAGSSSELVSYTVPAGVSFVRCAVVASTWENEGQLEKGVITPYVPPNNIFTPIKVGEGTILPSNFYDNGVADGFNIVPAGESGPGGWYVSGGSLVYSNSGGFAGFAYYIVPVDENATYWFSGLSRFFITVDSGGNVVDYSGNIENNHITTGAGAVKMYFTYDATQFPDGQIICKGETIRSETRYTAKWLGVNFVNRSIEGKSINNRVYCSIPKYVYMNTSESVKIYLNDILAQKGSYFWCNSVVGLTTYIDEEYLEITCATVGSYLLGWAVYDSNLQKIDEGTTTVIVSDLSSLTSKKGLVIGDSFVAYGNIPGALLNAFSDQGKTLTLIGTRGTAPNLHEGRGGWSARTYCDYASAGEFTNPFYNNGTFDFAYYMTQNGFSGLDYVFINLGINAIFNLTFREYSQDYGHEIDSYKKIIESIHDYDSNIKIFCNLPTPPNTQNGKFSQAYGTSQMLWLYANNIKHYAKDMIDTISGANVYIVGTNFVLDTNTDISDGVHPASGGYPKLAKAMINAVIGS